MYYSVLQIRCQASFVEEPGQLYLAFFCAPNMI